MRGTIATVPHREVGVAPDQPYQVLGITTAQLSERCPHCNGRAEIRYRGDYRADRWVKVLPCAGRVHDSSINWSGWQCANRIRHSRWDDLQHVEAV